MNVSRRQYLSALLCVCALPLCGVMAGAHAEISINDDWSYTRTAQLFAQTGHIHYNGWTSAMLGWQIVLGGLFIKLFGFSFGVVRASILLVGSGTALLVQRTYVRAGIREWNAALGTLLLMLSPLALPLSFSFMTDIPGLLVIVLSLYLCLRALQAGSCNKAIAWIALAALSNAIGGTVRQIAWLGLLVIVPSTIWLLRRSRSLLLCGVLANTVAVAMMVVAMHWFSRQPYTFPEPLAPMPWNAYNLPIIRANLCGNIVHSFSVLLNLVLPLLVVFLPALWTRSARIIPALLFLSAATAVYGFFCPQSKFLLLLNLLVILSTAGLCLFLFQRRGADALEPNEGAGRRVMGKQLVTLLGPFTLAYLALLLPRGTLGLVFDRYLLPLEFVTILALLRTMQKHMPGRLILFSGVPLLLYSTAGVATTHDKFALYRAQLTAINELRAAGVPPTAIDGGFAYNGWSELQISSHVNDARLPGATTATVLASYTAAARCQPEQGYLFPDLHARYLLTDSPRACGGRAPFTPVIYTVWTWWPHSETLYIVYGLSGPVQ